MMKYGIALLLLCLLGSWTDEKLLRLCHPKNKKMCLHLRGYEWEEMRNEYLGATWHYIAKEKNGTLCSVVFRKLTKAEMKERIQLPAKERKLKMANSPLYPYLFFRPKAGDPRYSVVNSWGSEKDDFMYCYTLVPEMAGQKLNQMHCYAYTMYGKDMFVEVHLLRQKKTDQDSAEVVTMLSAFSKH